MTADGVSCTRSVKSWSIVISGSIVTLSDAFFPEVQVFLLITGGPEVMSIAERSLGLISRIGLPHLGLFLFVFLSGRLCERLCCNGTPQNWTPVMELVLIFCSLLGIPGDDIDSIANVFGSRANLWIVLSQPSRPDIGAISGHVFVKLQLIVGTKIIRLLFWAVGFGWKNPGVFTLFCVILLSTSWFLLVMKWSTVQITFIFIGQTRLVFGKCVCTCVTKHSNAFQTFLNWLKNSKRVWHELKLYISRLPLFANFDLWSVSVWSVWFHSKLMFPKPLVKSIWAIMCDVTGHSHWIDNVRCKMHQTRLQVKRTSRLRLKRKLKSVWK